MVEVDEDRLKVLARGARWVSLSSAGAVRIGSMRAYTQIHTLSELPRHGCGCRMYGDTIDRQMERSGVETLLRRESGGGVCRASRRRRRRSGGPGGAERARKRGNRQTERQTDKQRGEVKYLSWSTVARGSLWQQRGSAPAYFPNKDGRRTGGVVSDWLTVRGCQAKWGAGDE